jgi:transcription elongation factor Elf1
MTIRIIGQDDSKIYRATCDICASILEYTLFDTRVIHPVNLGERANDAGLTMLDRVIDCPKCGNVISVDPLVFYDESES